jgi:hypothetical protein
MARVEVGRCEVCGSPLVVLPRTLRSEMLLPCPCGHETLLHLPQARLRALRRAIRRLAGRLAGGDAVITPIG